MTTDTSTQAKGDIRAQQAYFARLFNEGLNHSTSGSPVSITRESAQARLNYLKIYPMNCKAIVYNRMGTKINQYMLQEESWIKEIITNRTMQ